MRGLVRKAVRGLVRESSFSGARTVFLVFGLVLETLKTVHDWVRKSAKSRA